VSLDDIYEDYEITLPMRKALEGEKIEGAVTGSTYRLVIPRTDSGDEAVASQGNVMLERADVVGTNLVRNQFRVSVESLVRTLLTDDKLRNVREMDMVDRQESGPDRPRNTLPVSTE
jgi:hypothetical protein